MERRVLEDLLDRRALVTHLRHEPELREEVAEFVQVQLATLVLDYDIIGGIMGIVILLLLCRLMVVGKILIFENLGVGTLPTPPN